MTTKTRKFLILLMDLFPLFVGLVLLGIIGIKLATL